MADAEQVPPPADAPEAEGEAGRGLTAAVCALELAGADSAFAEAADASTEFAITIAPDGSATVKAGDASAVVPADMIAEAMGGEAESIEETQEVAGVPA